MNLSFPAWFLPTILSAFLLGIYDISKKHAVNQNSVMPVLFFATASGTLFFIILSLITGTFLSSIACTPVQGLLLLLKSMLVASSWTFAYYGMRELPISLAAPIRASSPLWTFIGSLFLFSEFPTLLQGIAMLLIFGSYCAFSLIGKMEGIVFQRSKGIWLIFTGTILGAVSALYDKYLLNVLHIPFRTVQMWFSLDLVLVLGLAYAVRQFCFGQKHKFVWRWSIPMTGILLILADYCYFMAVSTPEIRISILSLIRRCSCVVTFAVGAWYFRDKNMQKKTAALVLLLWGVILLALAK